MDSMPKTGSGPRRTGPQGQTLVGLSPSTYLAYLPTLAHELFIPWLEEWGDWSADQDGPVRLLADEEDRVAGLRDRFPTSSFYQVLEDSEPVHDAVHTLHNDAGTSSRDVTELVREPGSSEFESLSRALGLGLPNLLPRGTILALASDKDLTALLGYSREGDGLVSSVSSIQLTEVTGLVSRIQSPTALAVTDTRLMADPEVLERMIALHLASQSLATEEAPAPLRLVVSVGPKIILSEEAGERLETLGIPIIQRPQAEIQFSQVEQAVETLTRLSLATILAHDEERVVYEPGTSIIRTLDRITFDIVDSHTSGFSAQMNAVTRFLAWGA